MILKLSAALLVVLFSGNAARGQTCPPVLYGDEVYLMNPNNRWLSGAGIDGNDVAEGRDMDAELDQEARSSYKWKIRSATGNGLRSDTEALAGSCVKYGDTVYLQVMHMDRRYLTTSNTNGFDVITQDPAGLAGEGMANWQIRSSSGGGTDPRAGECVDYVSDTFFQMSDTSFLSLLFQWVIRSTPGRDGSKDDKTECPVYLSHSRNMAEEAEESSSLLGSLGSWWPLIIVVVLLVAMWLAYGEATVQVHFRRWFNMQRIQLRKQMGYRDDSAYKTGKAGSRSSFWYQNTISIPWPLMMV